MISRSRKLEQKQIKNSSRTTMDEAKNKDIEIEALKRKLENLQKDYDELKKSTPSNDHKIMRHLAYTPGETGTVLEDGHNIVLVTK